jgi:hypothetical protein
MYNLLVILIVIVAISYIIRVDIFRGDTKESNEYRPDTAYKQGPA